MIAILCMDLHELNARAMMLYHTADTTHAR